MFRQSDRRQGIFDVSSGSNPLAVGSTVPPVIDHPAGTSSPNSHSTTTRDEGKFSAPEKPVYRDRDITAFFASLITHVVLILLLALIPIINHITAPIVIQSIPVDESVDFELEDLGYSDVVAGEIGSNSIGEIDVALSTAPTVLDISKLATPMLATASKPTANVAIEVQRAVGLTKASQSVRGMTGYGVSGTDGAIDRITYEIMKSVQERPTLVVWLFDASISLSRRREEVRSRFDRVYQEIGQITKEPKGRKSEPPLLSSIYAFGNTVNPVLEKPTADLKTIEKAVGSIDTDPSGIEMVFSAITAAAQKYHHLRITKKNAGPERNVMIIAVTDERGNDSDRMDQTIELCKRYGMPVYVLGVPAPFGRSYTYIKYADPDPKKHKEGVWGQIDQGPETYMLERPLLGYGHRMHEEPMIDSGFGPYCLSRLCYETGGIFFTIHPNRVYDRDVDPEETQTYAAHLRHFFDPAVMERYRPDYLSANEYERMLNDHPLRAALVDASQMDAVEVLREPPTQFVKHEAINLPAEINRAQNISEELAPGLDALCKALKKGESKRATEISPRWLASFDLANASANAERIRNAAYRHMLNKLKRGMSFHYAESNAWILVPSSEMNDDVELQNEASEVTGTLERIITEHEHTPWAYLAERELERPLGWSWTEAHMTVTMTRGPSGDGAANSSEPRKGSSSSDAIPKF